MAASVPLRPSWRHLFALAGEFSSVHRTWRFFVSDMDVHCQELQLFQGFLCLQSGNFVEKLYSLNHEAVTKHCRDRNQGMLRFTTYGIKAK